MKPNPEDIPGYDYSADIVAICWAMYDVAKEQGESPFDLGPTISDLHADGALGWMGEVGRIAKEFNEWAGKHVDFEQYGEVWPYVLNDRFGTAVKELFFLDKLDEINKPEHWRMIAEHLGCPLRK